MTTSTGTTPRRATLAGATALTTAVLPVFLVGALGETIGRELSLSETAIGALVTTLFVSAAIAAPVAGRVVERVGAGIALRTGVLVAGTGAAVIGAFANGWWQLAAPMAVVGLAVAMIDTGSARAFADRVPARAQGFAFGIKEASIPGASMLAGLSLPTVAAVLGWRASFVAATAVAAVVFVLLPRPAAFRRHPDVPRDDAIPPPVGRVASAPIVRFAAGIGVGTGAATSAATFLVPSTVRAGIDPSVAGIVLSVASVGSIAARVGVGWWADREGAAPVPAVAAMLGAGAAASLVVASTPTLGLLVPAAVVLLGAGWGWTGLAFLAVVRANPSAPAAAAGVVLTGLGLGGALGPLAFGVLVDQGSYALAWTVAAGALAAGGFLAASARRALAPVPRTS